MSVRKDSFVHAVLSELEGLSRCARVGGAARGALQWVAAAGGALRVATSRGSLLASRAFTAESGAAPGAPTNDDRVLATALSLHHNLAADTANAAAAATPAANAALGQFHFIPFFMLY